MKSEHPLIESTMHRFANLPKGHDNPLDYAVSQRDRSTLEMVKEAVKHRQTLLAYQPILYGSSSDKIAFHEGLIRVLDPTGRVIPAREFMPVIQDTQLGREVDVLALRAGLIALREHADLRLSINMSARSIGYKPWTTMLTHWLDRDVTIGERLILEISEQSAMQMPELVASFMEQLQSKKICFALDNFGAGYTAIRYFKDMYFDILKIDGQFVRDLATNGDNRAVISTMLAIAHNFNMITVAEQVENRDDAEALSALGVDCQQGYYYAAPTTSPEWADEPEFRKSS